MKKQTTELELASPAADIAALAHSNAAIQASPFAGVNIAALLDKAVDSKAAVDVIERLQVLRKELRAEQAGEAFNAAMADFQNECPTIIKDKGVKTNSGQMAYKYAPIEVVESQIRPTEHKYGFNHRFDQDVDCPAGFVGVKCIVNHRAGHSITTTARYRLGGKTSMMSDTQQDAAAESFAKRRALANAYGLVIAGDDLDGATGKLKPSGPSKLAADDPETRDAVKAIWLIMEPVRGTEKNWDAANQWLWSKEILCTEPVETMPNLSLKRLTEILAKVKAVLK